MNDVRLAVCNLQPGPGPTPKKQLTTIPDVRQLKLRLSNLVSLLQGAVLTAVVCVCERGQTTFESL